MNIVVFRKSLYESSQIIFCNFLKRQITYSEFLCLSEGIHMLRDAGLYVITGFDQEDMK